MALVSIVVPTFNRAHCLARAIDSACAQSHGDVEVLVVDDGSTDGTEALVRDRYRTDPRVRYFRQHNAGVAAARNTGFRQVRGDFVALLDSDDEWLPWKLQLQLECLNAFPHVGMVWSDMAAFGPDGGITSPRYIRTMYSCWQHYPDPRLIFSDARPLRDLAPALAEHVGDALFYAGHAFSHMIRGSLVHTSTVVLRRERLDQVKAFNEALRPAGEDFDFHLRTCHAGPVGYLDLPTIRYQVGMPDRLTRPAYKLQIARNFLDTIEPFIRFQREDIDLPDAVLEGVMAEAHQWVGEESYWHNDRKAARRHLAASLRSRPAQPRAWKFWIASWLPTRWFAERWARRHQS